MSDETKPPVAPSEEHPYWVKNPETGQVGKVWKPEDIQKAQDAGFVSASQEEADKAYREEQLQGWKGDVAALGAGVTSVIPFAHNIVRTVAPQFGADVDEASEKHPWIKGAGDVAGIVAGGEVLKAFSAPIEAATAIGETAQAAAKLSVAAAGETGVAKAVPSLAARVLGRLPDAAKNGAVGLGYGGLQLTNEKDLPHDPEQLASHVMSTLFWNTAGGLVGGEVVHQLVKGASALANAAAKPIGKLGSTLDDMAAALKVGDGEEVIAKARGSLQDGVAAIDGLANQKEIDKGMEAVRKKVGDAGMGELDAARIKAETLYDDARANLMRKLGMKVTEGGKSVQKISPDKLAKALRSPDNVEVVEALQKFHEAGKSLQDFHEMLAKAGATGAEGLSAETAEQVDGLLEVQDAIKAGVVQAEGVKAGDEFLKAAGGYALFEHFGKMLLGKAYVAAKVGKVAWNLAPAEFRAARLAQLAQLAQAVDGHLERVSKGILTGGAGKYATPAVSALTVEDLRKLRDDVNQKLSNPQLAQDHLEEKAGAVNDYAPDTYGQMSLQYGAQLQTLAGILQWPTPPGAFDPKWQPSASDLAKMSTAVAIVKDPRVFEAKLAKGTATPAQAAVYKSAHGPRAEALTAKFLGGLKQGMKTDKGTLKTMTSMMVMGLGAPRLSYTQPQLMATQGLYSQRMNQQGGPGSRGGTSPARNISASQMITLPGQRVSNRPIK